MASAENVQIRDNRVVLSPTGPNYFLENHRDVTMTFTASAQFSGAQGQDQWQYRYWDGTMYRDLSYQPDPVNPYWYGPTGYSRISATGMHPWAGIDVTRAWVAPFAGTVRITGQVRKADTTANPNSDGVNVKLLHGSAVLVDRNLAATDGVGFPIDVTRVVTPGDTISFRLNPRATSVYDATAWNPVVTFLPSPTTSYGASTQFSRVQDQEQWRYEYWDATAGAYAPMQYHAPDTADPLAYWYGPAAHLRIYATAQHPAAGKDATRTWVAPSAGTITFTSHVKKGNVCGGGADGVQVQVLHGAATVLGPQTLADADTTGFAMNLTTPRVVAAGDAIRFRVNQLANNACDSTLWDPTIQFTREVTYAASRQFSGVQGQDQWRYEYTDAGSYLPMQYQPIDATHPVPYWFGPSGYHRIFAGSQHPTATRDAVRVWTAPAAGSFTIVGQVRKGDLGGGGGVLARVLHNATELFSQVIAFDDGVGYPVHLTGTVAAGDALYFHVNADGTSNYDATAWDPTIVFVQE